MNDLPTQDTQLTIGVQDINKARQLYRAINHKLRQNILRYIHNKGRITVTELYKHFKLEQSETSMHLSLLRKAGFVVTQRDGRFIFYSINYAKLDEVHKLSLQLTDPAK